jgi:hypothetical protein
MPLRFQTIAIQQESILGGPRMSIITDELCVKQVTQGVGHACHESIDDTNYGGGDLATYMRK